MQPLMGKKIAILGGMGARGEARDALIEELGLAGLEWVYSERNKVKEFAKFCESVYPGKYDYIFLLTKFISHKVWEHIKKYNLSDIRLVRVNGSYNAEGFIRALLEQYPVKEPARTDTTLEAPVFKRLLTLAEADNSAPVPTQEEPAENSETVFRAKSSEEIVLSARVQALEAQVKRLQQNQQDPALVKSATLFYKAFVDFVGDYPIPPNLEQAKIALLKFIPKHNVDGDKIMPPSANNKDTDIMLSNIVLSELLVSTMGTIRFFTERVATDKQGACIVCRRHKSIGCLEDCLVERTMQIHKYISKGLQVAKGPNVDDVLKFLKKRVSEYK